MPRGPGAAGAAHRRHARLRVEPTRWRRAGLQLPLRVGARRRAAGERELRHGGRVAVGPTGRSASCARAWGGWRRRSPHRSLRLPEPAIALPRARGARAEPEAARSPRSVPSPEPCRAREVRADRSPCRRTDPSPRPVPSPNRSPSAARAGAGPGRPVEPARPTTRRRDYARRSSQDVPAHAAPPSPARPPCTGLTQPSLERAFRAAHRSDAAGRLPLELLPLGGRLSHAVRTTWCSPTTAASGCRSTARPSSRSTARRAPQGGRLPS
jgi:hypothetical protein